MNELANQLDARLAKCRMAWWKTKSGELCIDNKEVAAIAPGRVLMTDTGATGKIVPKSGRYVKKRSGKGFEVRTSVAWSKGKVSVDQIVE